MFGWIDERLVSCWDCNLRHVQQLLDDDDLLFSLPFCTASDAVLFSLSMIIRPCPGGRCSIVLHLLGQLQWSASLLCLPKPPFFSCSCRADDLPLLLLLAVAAAIMAASRAEKGEVSISAAAIVVEKSM